MRLPDPAPTLQDLWPEVASDLTTMQRVMSAQISPTHDGRYRHWDDLRRLTPPAGLSVREWWFAVKLARAPLLKPLPLLDAAGRPCAYTLPDSALEKLHQIDQHASGGIATSELVVNPDERERYIVRSLIEEAITSSQLEGANTTRQVAKEMLRSGRAPRDRSEQMIVNNFAAMNYVREVSRERLTPAMVLHIHELVTDQTIDSHHSGRLQRADEQRVVVADPEDNVLHRPPPAEQLEERLTLMCKFANGELTTSGFLHPVVRAVVLHFWLAYDHPFVDGNGRTARALFYWSLLSQGYWLSEFLSISRILHQAPTQYARSFLHTETDENDTTYFILYQLDVICRALSDLHEYLGRKMGEVREVETLVPRGAEFNHRQLALLSHALRHRDAHYTFASHARSHNVVYQSGRTDLLDLERRGLLQSRKVGRRFVFTPAPDLAQRLQAS